MSMETDRIFDLLPAYLRVRDVREGQLVKGRVAPDDGREPEDFGPLRTLASLIAREGQIVEEGLEQLYDDAFIETCAPWVIPYLGDLLGVRGLADIPEGIDMRARVADALELRSRKGTLRALEHASSTASNWPVMAVEYWKRLVHAQSMRLVHPDQGAAVDMRDKPALARIGKPYSRSSRNVEVRRIDTAGGRWNLGNIGLHVWRLRPYSLTSQRAFPVAAGRRDFRFHPLNCDAQLFAPTGIRNDIDTPTTEASLPEPISRAIMAEDVARFYGADKALSVSVGGTEVPLAEVKVAHLGDLPGGGAEPPWNRSAMADVTLIDPELGRVVVGDNRTGVVRLTCNLARPLEIGGGEHSRRSSVGSVEDGVTAPVGTNLVTTIAAEGNFGTILLDQTTRYTLNGAISVPAGEFLRLVASDGAYPTIRVGAQFAVALGAGAQLEINGIRVTNGGLVVSGTPASVVIRDCSFTPGLSVDRLGDAVSPGALSIDLNIRGASVLFERTISGPVRVTTDMDIRFRECILDAGSIDDRVVFARLNALRHVMAFDRCTLRGRVETDAFADGARNQVEGFGVVQGGEDRLATSDTVFFGSLPAITAARRQVGCIRFSYVPDGSITPRLYRCTDAPAPVFASLRSVDPDYMLYAPRVGNNLRRGAENGDEIGAYNRAAHSIRTDNITRTISDFLRFGHAAGIFNET